MFSSKVLHSFIEGMKKEKVVWYEDNYYAVRDGTGGHHQHQEVESHFEVVKQAIEDPNQVNKGKLGLSYYAWYTGGKDYPNSHMKVVLRRTMFGRLKVVTAYFTTQFSSNEKLLWTKTQKN